jgi:hypothetical protein
MKDHSGPISTGTELDDRQKVNLAVHCLLNLI